MNAIMIGTGALLTLTGIGSGVHALFDANTRRIDSDDCSPIACFLVAVIGTALFVAGLMI